MTRSARWRWRVMPLVMALAAVSGCATSGTVKKVQEDSELNHSMLLGLGEATTELRREVGQLRRHLGALRDELAGMARQEEARQQEALADIHKRLEAAEARVEALAGAVRGVEMSVGGLTDQVARLEALPARPARERPKPRAPARKPKPRPSVSLGAEDLFDRALENLKGGELGQAILDFEDFLAKHSSHALAGAARFWIGEAYFAARDYKHATEEYQKAVDIAPKGEKTPEALLKMGLAYRALKRNDRAREIWTQLLRDFPQSDAAQKARTALREVSSAARRSDSSQR